MSGRKNDELKKLRNKQTKFTPPSKKAKKSSQEESEYQKIMLENQEEKLYKEVLKLLEKEIGTEDKEKITGWERNIFEEKFEERKIKASTKVKSETYHLELWGKEETIDKTKEIRKEIDEEDNDSKINLILPEESKESENFSIAILVKKVDGDDIRHKIDLVAIKKEDREKLKGEEKNKKKLTIKTEQSKNVRLGKSPELEKQTKEFDQEEIKRIEKEEEGWLKNFKSSLFEAIMKEKSVERVKSLLGENKEIVVRIINEETNDSLTLLHLAVGINNLEIAKLLLENGADTITTDDSEENCFHYAAFRGNLEMLKLLAKYAKDIKSAVNAHSKTGLSVLHRAASGVEKSDKNWPIIGWLLEKGANPDYKANNRFAKFPKEEAIEDIFSKDISYRMKYQRIVEEFKKRQEELKEKNKGELSFKEVVEGKEEVIAELSESAKKKRKKYLETLEEFLKSQENLAKLSRQLELERESLISEIGTEKIVEAKENDSEFVASIEVAPWK